MKKIILSAAVAAMAFSTSAVAADKGIDIDVSGQAVVYYQTQDSSKAGVQESLASSDSSMANVGVQLNLASDLGNNFTFGSQITYLNNAGLNRTVVDAHRQDLTGTANSTTDNLALTKMFIAKKIANTTVKLGRQELPKSLSPLAFSEGWSVFKNTFDAILAVNTDLPKTTLVGAYVTTGTDVSDLGLIDNMRAASNLNDVSGLGNNSVDGEGAAYMLTAQTKLVPMSTITASFYSVKGLQSGAGVATAGDADMSAEVMWLDAQIADKSFPMGLSIGLQAGNIDPNIDHSATGAAVTAAGFKLVDTTAYGVKVALKPISDLTLSAAYSDVDGGKEDEINVEVTNFGGVKSPLYTQMVWNQGIISKASDTLVLKGAYNMGDMGSVSLAYGMTDDNSFQAVGATANDYNELDLVYKVKAGGVQYFAAYVNRDFDGANDTALSGNDANYDVDVIRLWARYNF